MYLEHQKQLKKKYPNLYKHLFEIDRKKLTAISLGINCLDGWFDLILDFSNQLNDIDPEVKMLNIDSIGELVVEVDKKTKDINKLIETFRDKSLTTCEFCGKPGKIASIKFLPRKYIVCGDHK